MKDYSILMDETIYFSQKEQFFVMVVNDNNKLYLEINNRQSLLVRWAFNPKANHKGIHSFVTRKLKRIRDYGACKALIQFAFNQSLLKESLFLIDLVSTGDITWDIILKLQELHKFNLSFEFDNTETDDRHKLKTVYVKFIGNKKALGKFIKKKSCEEFEFIKDPA